MKADIYNQNCPSRTVLEIISNKWTILIIEKLAQKPYRFSELQREIGGISAKVLTQLLKKLEKNKLVIRHDYEEIQLKVEYSLSPLGRSLSNVCHAITAWAESYIDQLK